MEVVQPSKEAMGIQQVQDRCVCSEAEQEAASVLQPISGFQCTSNRRISSKVAKERTVLKSAMEINPKDSEEDKRRQNQGSRADHAVVTNTVLAEPIAEDETTEDTGTNMAQSTMILSRIDVIFQKRVAEGLTIEDVDFLT
jgi:hypothetical protein